MGVFPKSGYAALIEILRAPKSAKNFNLCGARNQRGFAPLISLAIVQSFGNTPDHVCHAAENCQFRLIKA